MTGNPGDAARGTGDFKGKLVDVLTRVTAVAGLVALGPSIWLSIEGRTWFVLYGAVAANIWVGLLALLPAIPYRVKISSLVVLAYVIGVLVLWQTGPYGAGQLYIFAFVFLAALFGGRLSIFLANGLALLTHLAFAWAKGLGLIPWEQDVDVILVISVNFIVVSLLLSFSARYLVGKYAEAAATEGELRRSLEMMVREIEHRVKNNLQVISSMVSLKTRSAADPRQAIEEIKTSLSAISSVHQILIRREAFYIVQPRVLVESLVGRYRQLHPDILFRSSWEGGEAEMDSERAVTLGLLVNEIVTNSIKHAFPEGGGGSIFLELRYAEERRELELRIGDDGPGRRGGEAERAGSSGTGLRIIEALARQLGAELSLDPGDSWVYRLRFVIDAPRNEILGQSTAR